MWRRFAAFVEIDKDQFINRENHIVGHFVANFAAHRERGAPKFNGNDADFDNIALFWRSDEVDFRNKFRYNMPIFKLNDGI